MHMPSTNILIPLSVFHVQPDLKFSLICNLKCKSKSKNKLTVTVFHVWYQK